jgi:hypothetical protein
VGRQVERARGGHTYAGVAEPAQQREGPGSARSYNLQLSVTAGG